MSLATGPALRELYGRRLSGQDGYYDAFELVFFPGSIPPTTKSRSYSSPLVVFDLPSNWAVFNASSGTIMITPMTRETIAPGVVTHFRFNGILGAVHEVLQQGSVTKTGEGGDIQFPSTGWSVGLPVTLVRLYLRPPQMNM